MGKEIAELWALLGTAEADRVAFKSQHKGLGLVAIEACDAMLAALRAEREERIAELCAARRDAVLAQWDALLVRLPSREAASGEPAARCVEESKVRALPLFRLFFVFVSPLRHVGARSVRWVTALAVAHHACVPPSTLLFFFLCSFSLAFPLSRRAYQASRRSTRSARCATRCNRACSAGKRSSPRALRAGKARSTIARRSSKCRATGARRDSTSEAGKSSNSSRRACVACRAFSALWRTEFLSSTRRCVCVSCSFHVAPFGVAFA